MVFRYPGYFIGRNELTEVPGTGIEIVPNLTKWYRARSEQFPVPSVFRSGVYRYPGYTWMGVPSVTVVQGTGIEVVRILLKVGHGYRYHTDRSAG